MRYPSTSSSLPPDLLSLSEKGFLTRKNITESTFGNYLANNSIPISKIVKISVKYISPFQYLLITIENTQFS